MRFDPLVANPGRLAILTALVVEPQEFVRLRRATELTDGNLSTHARRLSGAGLIAIHKSIENGKSATRLSLTSAGRAALQSHSLELIEALNATAVQAEARHEESRDEEDDWID